MRKQSSFLPNLKRGSLVELVCSTLRNEILSGKYQKGERLASQEEFCKQLGVSRTVIREAWNKLSSMGLIQTLQGQGSFVSSPSAQKVIEPMSDAIRLDKSTSQELLETRFYLETITVRLAAHRSEEKDIAKLNEIVAQMENHSKKNNAKATIEYDIAFHQAIAEISQNMLLKQFLLTISMLIQRFLEDYTKVPGTSQRAVNYHKRIIKAIEQKKPDLAEVEMKDHLMDVINTLQRQFGIKVNIYT